MQKSAFSVVPKMEENKYVAFNNSIGVFAMLKDNIDNLYNSDNEYQDKLIDDDSLNFNLKLNRLKGDVTDFQYTILITYNCNLRCIYCCEENIKRNIYMSAENARKVVDFIVNNSRKNKISKVKVMFYGGEPLLNSDIIRLIGENLKIQLNNNDILFESSMISNGILISPDILNMLESINMKLIQITLDGPKEIHDERRISVDGNSYFDTIIRNINLALSKFKVIVKMNFDKGNVDYIPNLIDILDETIDNKNNLIVKFAPTYDLCTKRVINSKFMLSNEETANRLLQLVRYAKSKNFFVDENVIGTTQCDVCPKNGIVIDPMCNMYKCIGYVGLEEYCIGNILTHVSGKIEWRDFGN